MLKALIFDMDGVLIDSEPLHKDMVDKFLKSAGAEKGEISIEELAGMSQKNLCLAISDKWNLPYSEEQILKMFREQTNSYFAAAEFEEMPGASQIIKAFRKQGLKTAVASASSIELVELIMKKLGLYEHMDQLCGEEHVERIKPEPDIYLLTAKRLGVLPEECLVVEDTPIGVEAAKNANMKCIALHNKYTDIENLTLADDIIENLIELDQKRISRLFYEE